MILVTFWPFIWYHSQAPSPRRSCATAWQLQALWTLWYLPQRHPQAELACRNKTTVLPLMLTVRLDRNKQIFNLWFKSANYWELSCFMGNYFCSVNGIKHARVGQTELYLSHTLTHTSLWRYGEGAKCVGEMEGRIDRAAKECCKPWKKTKASCFPTVHQTLLAWELQRYHQHFLTLSHIQKTLAYNHPAQVE